MPHYGTCFYENKPCSFAGDCLQCPDLSPENKAFIASEDAEYQSRQKSRQSEENRANNEPNVMFISKDSNVDEWKQSVHPKSVVYICSKYSGDIVHNVEMAKEYCRFAVSLGVCPLAPHLMLPQFMNERTERDTAIEMDKIFLRKCDELWIFTDKNGKISNGMSIELEEARRLNMPIKYFTS